MSDSDIELINLLTQETRFGIVADILAHPHNAPTLRELEYTNPDVSDSTIRDHLDVLREAGLIAKVTVKGDVPRDEPSVFYVMTKNGLRLLEQHNILVEDLDELQEMYLDMDKPRDIQRYEDAPRPGGSDAPNTYRVETKNNDETDVITAR